ncbi:MAG: hypothetical protein K2X08_02725 [Chlamydiales bacterium]|nr:hypothetical protein [Chlamydiales bacterium]
MEEIEAKKILLVGGIFGGTEEVFHQKRNNENTILQSYFEAWWEIIQELRKQHIEIEFGTHQLIHDASEKYDLYIVQNHKMELPFEIEEKSFLILFESIAVLPLQFKWDHIKRYAKVFSWNDDIIKEHQAIKFCYPVWKPFEGELPFSQRKFSCMIASNKQFPYAYELYTEREKIIQYHEGSVLFDLYGKGWGKKQYSTHRGISINKMNDLKKYRFTYCLENSYKNNNGYITEKIFDAFAAGAIPIYKGASNIYQYIPSHCFIDYDRFASLEELDQFLFTFTEEDYNRYLFNILMFLESSESKIFTSKAFVDIILPEILNYFSPC